MPELPEVETIIAGLRPRVVGRAFLDVRVLPGNPTLVRGFTPDALAAHLRSRRVTGITRRGKYILFALDNGETLVVHLRMTGALLHRRPADVEETHTRAVLVLDDGTELRFVDMRKFGTLQLTGDVAEVLGHLGVEPFSPEFTPACLTALIDARRAPVKSFLLNQALIAGMGNIYADEALFAAGIDPSRPVGSLSPAEVERLHRAILDVLCAGVRHRGVSFRNYRDTEGNAGRNQAYVKVFRRTGQPCDVCGSPIVRIKVAGRSTHSCPRCQR